MNRYLPSTDADNDRDSGDDCAGQQYDLADGMFTVTVFFLLYSPCRRRHHHHHHLKDIIFVMYNC